MIDDQLENIVLDLVKSGVLLLDSKTNKYYKSPLLEMKTMEISLGFENVAIKQKKNICQSRLDVEISSEIIRGIQRPIPLIAANMSTVCNADFCIKLYNIGALGIMHRADSDDKIIEEIRKISKHCDIVASSIGIGNDQFDLAKKFIDNGSNVVVIDIAHGFSDQVINLARSIKKYSKETKVIVGNVVNEEFVNEVCDFADAIKVGIAQGFACDTKNTAGCTEKQFSAVLKFKHLSKMHGIPIISDGGIREPADFVKAIGAGANSVMAGKIFASCPESAAEIVDGKKLYAGMASKYVHKKWKGQRKNGTCYEGSTRLLDIGEPVHDLVEKYSGALRSGITYAGGFDIKSFQNNVEFVRI